MVENVPIFNKPENENVLICFQRIFLITFHVSDNDNFNWTNEERKKIISFQDFQNTHFTLSISNIMIQFPRCKKEF